MATHCQICGREIKSSVRRSVKVNPQGNCLPAGLDLRSIAHHGYHRPGHGWQTTSCYGAKWRPYELANDALPGAIEALTAWLVSQEFRLRGLKASLESESRSSAWGKPAKVFTHPRPADFDVATAMDTTCYVLHGSYLQLFQRKVRTIQADLKSAREELARLDDRLNNWLGEVTG